MKFSSIQCNRFSKVCLRMRHAIYALLNKGIATQEQYITVLDNATQVSELSFLFPELPIMLQSWNPIICQKKF